MLLYRAFRTPPGVLFSGSIFSNTMLLANCSDTESCVVEKVYLVEMCLLIGVLFLTHMDFVFEKKYWV